MVFATLPIVDWNKELADALAGPAQFGGSKVYAAIFAIDPFICWEDVVDLLRGAGIDGVCNFPPAALTERSWGRRVIPRRCH